jgi:hypothetical protein
MNKQISGNDILNALVSDELTDAAVIAVVNEYRRRKRSEKLLAAQTLKIGERCSISGIRPKRLNGTVGTIISFNRTNTRADLKVETSYDALRPKGAPIYGIPLVCLTKVEDN